MLFYAAIVGALLVSQGNAQLDCSARANTQPMTCQSSTQPTCANPDPKIILMNCRTMCVCKYGFVLFNGNCIPIDECPKDLLCSQRRNTVFQKCRSSIQPTCENPRPTLVTFDCRDQCVCKPGHVLNSRNECVLLADCPQNPNCVDFPNTIFATCQSSTQPTCDMPRPSTMLADCRDKCICKPGYLLHNGSCIPVENCPKPDCSKLPNSEIKTCQPHRQPTCFASKSQLAINDCVTMCVCKEGFILHGGECIATQTCEVLKKELFIVDIAAPNV